jgi:hypothetical protein
MPVGRRIHLALWLSVVLAVGLALLKAGTYGWTLFVIVPFALGLLAASIVCPATARQAAVVGVCSILLACSLLSAFAFEGAVCIVMSLPIVVPLACLGAVLGFRLEGPNIRPQAGAAILILPIAAFSWDLKAPVPVFRVTTEVVIRATPERVWRHVIAFPKLPETRDWVFHTGLAYPTEARIDGSGPGSTRYCQFSTGAFVEPVTVWDEPHLLRFRVSQNPAPLHEWSPWGEIDPKHLHGYLVSEEGQFRLTAVPGGRTVLAGTTWYRHSLWPAQYWRWWSDAIIHRIHLRVLNHVRNLAEEDNGSR